MEKELINAPEILLKYKDLLCKLNPDEQKISYDLYNWKSYFNLDPDLIAISEAYPSSISRGNLRELSQKSIKDRRLIRRLFLAIMMWGFGTAMGFGPYRTFEMLNDHNASKKLYFAFNNVLDGEILLADFGFKLPWCGVSFSTKFYYYIGLGADLNPLPLILDRRVAKILILLLQKEGLNPSHFMRYTQSEDGDIALRKYSEGYIRYIDLLNEWAEEIGCRPDAIEYFLWKVSP